MFLLTFPLGNDYQKKRWTMVPTCSACSSNQLGSSARSSQKIAEPRASRPRCWPLAVGVFLGGAVVVVVVVAWFLPIESSLEKNEGKFKKSQKENSSYCNIKTPNWPKIEDLFWSRSTVTNSWVLKVKDFLGWVYMTHIERPCKIPTQCNWGPGTKRGIFITSVFAERLRRWDHEYHTKKCLQHNGLLIPSPRLTLVMEEIPLTSLYRERCSYRSRYRRKTLQNIYQNMRFWLTRFPPSGFLNNGKLHVYRPKTFKQTPTWWTPKTWTFSKGACRAGRSLRHMFLPFFGKQRAASLFLKLIWWWVRKVMHPPLTITWLNQTQFSVN